MDRILDTLNRWSQLPEDLRKLGVNDNAPANVSPEKRREYSRAYRVKYSAICRTRSRLSYYIRKRGLVKGDHTVNYLGCTESEYRAYLERLFTDGMSWEAFEAGEIHVDHIVPVSHFGDSEAELRRAFHYTNTQPMWARDNHSKGARWSGAVQPDLFLPVLTKPDLRRRRRRRPLT